MQRALRSISLFIVAGVLLTFGSALLAFFCATLAPKYRLDAIRLEQRFWGWRYRAIDGGGTVIYQPEPQDHLRYRFEFGFPFLAFVRDGLGPDAPAARVGQTLWVGRGQRAATGEHTFLHVLTRTTARWPLVVPNAAAFAGALGGAMAGFTLVRRRRRLARGCCPACGYPMGLAPRCTECGARLPVR